MTLIVVNGVGHEVSAEPDRTLLFVLRDELGLTGAKYGCGEGECGACTVLVDGEPVGACTIRVGEILDRAITTVEGLVDGQELHPVQRAFIEIGAMQCGYCTPGMVVAASALLSKTRDPNESQIREALGRNVCRCCTYPRILRAVRRAAELTASPDERPSAQGATEEGPLQETFTVGEGPWDLRSAEDRDYFPVLSDGLVVVLPPAPTSPGMWSTSGGAWIHVGANARITAFTGKVDVGQDNRTALSQLVAAELCVPFDAVRLVMGDTDVCPFDMGTFGSRSMPDAGEGLRAAAAVARELLVAMAAKRWGVDPKSVAASGGRIGEPESHPSFAYGDLLKGVRRVEIVSTEAPPVLGLRPPTGEPTPKVNALGIVTGAKLFPADRTRAGMLHGAVLRPPAFGATLRSADLTDARAVPGVTAVHEGDFVGVAAPDPFTSRRALQGIRAEWDFSAQPSERDLIGFLRSHPGETEGWGGAFHHEAGDVDGALTEADVRLTETYTTAYVAHVPLEPRAALAEWEGERLTVWTGTQRPFGVRQELAEALDVEEARVRVIAPDAGAGFGGKHTGEAAVEAARLARASGRPVRVRWSREEEFTWGYVRPAAVIDVSSGIGSEGTLSAWEFTNLNSGPAAISCPYEIPNQRIDYRPCGSPLRQGSYRALAATANHFARESHIDEVADRVDADPLEFRLRHLADERLAAVFRAAAERAGWANRSSEPGRGMGIAGGVEKDARVANCIEVRVHADGRLEIQRIVCAFECGAIVNPDNLVNQIEGATVMGMGGALFEAVHFGDGRILNPHLALYRVPRFSDVPAIDVVLIDRTDLPSAGAGETPIVAVAPAIANAIFAATGRRIRSMPLLPDGIVH